MNTKSLLSLAMALISLLAVAQSWAAEAPSKSVTLYSDGRAVVRELHPLSLKTGEQEVLLTGLSNRLQPSAIWVTAPQGVGLSSYRYGNGDLSRELLLSHSVGMTVRFKDETASTQTANVYRSGQLLGWQPGTPYLVLKTDRGTEVVEERLIHLEALPTGLSPVPTLALTLSSPKNQTLPVQVGYLQDGLRSELGYQAVLDGSEETLHLQSWLTVYNDTGRTIGPTQLQVLAGQPRREEGPRLYKMAQRAMPMMAEAAMLADGMAGGINASNESFSDYYLISLPKPVILPMAPQSVSFNWLDQAAVPFKRRYVFDPNPGSIWFGYQDNGTSERVNPFHQVTSQIEFRNQSQQVASGSTTFGQGLPMGHLRVYQPDTSGSQQLVGEMDLPMMPKDEPVKVTLGQAFDVLAEKKQLSFQQRSTSQIVKGQTLVKTVQEASYQVVLKNRKTKPVTVEVLEHPYGEWKLVSSSQPAKEQWQNHLRFDVTVPSNGSTTLTYTLRQVN